MRAFPPASELQWLRRGRLEYVGVSETSLWFTFDGGGLLQTETPATLTGPDDEAWRYEPGTRNGEWMFHRLLGRQVAEVRRLDEMTLETKFDGGWRLVLHSDEGPYECGRIRFPDGAELFF